MRRPRVLVPIVLAVLMLGAGAAWLVKRYRDARWAREVAVPEISRLADQGRFGEFGEAYTLAVKAEKSIPGDPVLARLWPVISYQTSVETTPAGADVYRRAYSDANAPWELVVTHHSRMCDSRVATSSGSSKSRGSLRFCGRPLPCSAGIHRRSVSPWRQPSLSTNPEDSF